MRRVEGVWTMVESRGGVDVHAQCRQVGRKEGR